jgi:hypothetical protein
MGVVFAFLYGIIALLYPGSFIVAGKTIQPELSRFDCHLEIIYLIYYSFVIPTTMGYGDIMPTSAPANAHRAVLRRSGDGWAWNVSKPL